MSMKNDTLRLGTKVQGSSVTGFNFNYLAGLMRRGWIRCHFINLAGQRLQIIASPSLIEINIL